MKSLFAFLVLATSSLALAHNDCIDVRTALFGPCDAGQDRVFVQGQCPQTYQVESTYCSVVSGEPECIDVRAAFFAPCDDGKTRIYVQGKCEKSYEVEHTYCTLRNKL